MTVPNKPLISVALCTYNGAAFLHEQLESLLAQDHAPLEIVAVDDGSTDRTVAILEEYRRRDPRIAIHRNSSNLGFRRNFERAIELCRGELIATCDQDDIWLPGKLRTLASAIGNSALAYCDSELIDESGHRLGLRTSELMNMYAGNDPKVFTFHNCVSGHAMLFRRTLIDKARPFPTAGYHDWWLTFAAAVEGPIVYVDKVLVWYRRHSRAQSSVGRGQLDEIRNRKRPLKHPAEVGQWLEALQRQSRGPEQAFFRDLAAHWAGRQRRYFTPGLWWLVLRYRHSLFSIPEPTRLGRCLRSLRYLWGMKAKNLLNFRRYTRAS